MRNRPFQNYPDDADYTTNSPSYYADLARKQKLIELLSKRIWEYDEELAERFEAWDLNLENFPDNVELLLQDWLSDGTLDHIINETIFNMKADKSELDKTHAQLLERINSLGELKVNGVYPSWTTLTEQRPDGDNGVYIVTSDGKWYYWHTTDSMWKAGGVFQTSYWLDTTTIQNEEWVL